MRMNTGDHFEAGQGIAGVSIRLPRPEDGPRVWRLVTATGALDNNSLYANLLQCSHFTTTCALAEIDGEIVGWMSAYVPPRQPDTLFVWQICVADAARGQGLAQRLISAVLARSENAALHHVECTITPSNSASWALFGKVADTLEADLNSQPHFLSETHLSGLQESEMRVTIGPFETVPARLPVPA